MATNRLLIEDKLDSIVTEMSKQNTLLSVLAADKMSTLMSDWDSVDRIVKSGNANSIFDYGDTFTDTWKDVADSNKEYAVPWGVRHFEDVELEDGETLPGMFLQWDYAMPFGVQFSHQRAFLACPDGLAAGTYYFTIESSWGTNVAAGDVVCFTLTSAVPAGGRIAGCYSAPDQKKSAWKIYSYSADGKTINETVTPAFTASGTSLGTMHLSKREGNLNSCQEMAYGYARWKTSALRQFLNSDKGVNEWWTAQDAWDIAPDQLTTKAGFLSGLSDELKAHIKPIKVTTYTNTVTDDGTTDITYDKVFIPSLQQMYCAPQIAGEGEYWEYWKRASQRTSPCAQYDTYPQMITYAIENHVSAQTITLRSCNRGDASFRWFVGSSGIVVHYYSASDAYRCAPACVLA